MSEEEIKFEKAMERLEKIVSELESGEITLEDALKKYEEGVKLSRLCQEKLTQAEKKIEVLTRTLDGSLKKTPFEFEEENNGKNEDVRKKTKKKTEKNSGEDEDLLI
ncbi:MAG: exodeoxyribonuclease VII small subunit [Candidatus Omnitrophica bacterium]|nr:exodeoxyribonuclease VII small subunit [Candidatus Omnitrophota bacterium]